MWDQIPPSEQAKFLPFGPVKTSRSEDDDVFIYVWNKEGREIGYYVIPLETSFIFAPACRSWHNNSLEGQIFHNIGDIN